jgi:hypothetical protein
MDEYIQSLVQKIDKLEVICAENKEEMIALKRHFKDSIDKGDTAEQAINRACMPFWISKRYVKLLEAEIQKEV